MTNRKEDKKMLPIIKQEENIKRWSKMSRDDKMKFCVFDRCIANPMINCKICEEIFDIDVSELCPCKTLGLDDAIKGYKKYLSTLEEK